VANQRPLGRAIGSVAVRTAHGPSLTVYGPSPDQAAFLTQPLRTYHADRRLLRNSCAIAGPPGGELLPVQAVVASEAFAGLPGEKSSSARRRDLHERRRRACRISVHRPPAPIRARGPPGQVSYHVSRRHEGTSVASPRRWDLPRSDVATSGGRNRVAPI